MLGQATTLLWFIVLSSSLWGEVFWGPSDSSRKHLKTEVSPIGYKDLLAMQAVEQ